MTNLFCMQTRLRIVREPKPVKVLSPQDSIRARLDPIPEHMATNLWLHRAETSGADEPYIGRCFHNITALKTFNKSAPMQPIPVPLEKIRDLKGILGKGVLKGESDPFSWLDVRYGTTKALLERELGKPLKIFTRSDLIAHADYMALLDPFLHDICIVIPGTDSRLHRLLEPGAPSISRRIAAANTLAEAGFRVKLIHQQYCHADLPEVMQEGDISVRLSLKRLGLNSSIRINTIHTNISDRAIKRIKKTIGLK